MVAHSTLTGADLHEPKDIDSATVDEIYVADGAGGGTWKQVVFTYTTSLTPASVAANTTAEQTFTVTGLNVTTDFIASVSKPTTQAGLGIVGYRIPSNNNIAITFSNNTGGAIVPTAAETYRIVAVRP